MTNTDKQKPILSLTLPIKCSTAKSIKKNTIGVAGSFLGRGYDRVASSKLTEYTLIGIIDIGGFIGGFCLISLLLFLAGVLGTESIQCILTGQQLMDKITFVGGGVIGIIVGWILIGISEGTIKISCIHPDIQGSEPYDKP